MIKVIVFVPLAGYNPPQEFVESYQATKNHLLSMVDDVVIAEYFCPVYPISANRNACVGHAIEGFDGFGKPDTTIWLDADMSFPVDTLFNLLREDDLPVVSGMYYLKKEPHSPMAFKRWKYDKKDKIWIYLPYVGHPVNEMFKVHMVGMGCVRIDRDVLEKVWKKAYLRGDVLFKYRKHSEMERDDNHPGMEFLIKYGVEQNTEESYFWPQVVDSGYDIWVNPMIKCVHWTKKGVDQEDYFRNLLGMKFNYNKEQWDVINKEI